jgi:hypothetical protein
MRSAASGTGLDQQAPPGRHRIATVDRKVENGELQLRRVGADRAEVGATSTSNSTVGTDGIAQKF